MSGADRHPCLRGLVLKSWFSFVGWCCVLSFEQQSIWMIALSYWGPRESTHQVATRHVAYRPILVSHPVPPVATSRVSYQLSVARRNLQGTGNWLGRTGSCAEVGHGFPLLRGHRAAHVEALQSPLLQPEAGVVAKKPAGDGGGAWDFRARNTRFWPGTCTRFP